MFIISHTPFLARKKHFLARKKFFLAQKQNTKHKRYKAKQKTYKNSVCVCKPVYDFLTLTYEKVREQGAG